MTDRRKRVLLDECLPHPLRHLLGEFDAQTAAYAGLSGLLNGKLIIAMQNRFDVLLSVDLSLPHQHNWAMTGIALVVMSAVGNRLEDLEPLFPAVNEAIRLAGPGEVRIVS